jgi:NAD(P)-dependent dehydrogenase (short-subunit alcohol dehydrogenase family)
MDAAAALTSLPQRVLVTGAASGIGRETALLLRELDVGVLATDLPAAGLAELEAAGADTVAGDLRQAPDRDRVLAAAGELDGLVNAAGIIRLTPLEQVSDEDWDPILDVNLKAAFYLARDAGTRMPRGGSIVNVSSLAARYGANAEALCYAASKAAILAVTRGLAHAFGSRGVRVNAVLPGIIETPMQEGVLKRISAIRGVSKAELEASRTRLIPLEQRAGSARECATSIAFLLSGASSYITGQAISVGGGVVMP